jgi:hypothetical protein
LHSKFGRSLCKNRWEKHHSAFVKVVEGSKIYNFPIHHLVHFSSKFGRKSCSKCPKLKRFRHRNATSRAPRDRTRRASRGRAPPDAMCLPQDAPRHETPWSFPTTTRVGPPFALYHSRSRTAPSSGLSAAPLPCASYHGCIFVAPTSRSSGAAYLKVVHPPRARHASAICHGRCLSKLLYLLTFLAATHVNLYLGASRTSPCHALLWQRRRLAVGKTAVAAGAEHRRAHAPAPRPPQLRPKKSPRWACTPPRAPTRPRAPPTPPEFRSAAPPPPPRATLRDIFIFQGVLCKVSVWLWICRKFQGPRCKTLSQIVKPLCWILENP